MCAIDANKRPVKLAIAADLPKDVEVIFKGHFVPDDRKLHTRRPADRQASEAALVAAEPGSQPSTPRANPESPLKAWPF